MSWMGSAVAAKPGGGAAGRSYRAAMARRGRPRPRQEVMAQGNLAADGPGLRRQGRRHGQDRGEGWLELFGAT